MKVAQTMQRREAFVLGIIMGRLKVVESFRLRLKIDILVS